MLLTAPCRQCLQCAVKSSIKLCGCNRCIHLKTIFSWISIVTVGSSRHTLHEVWASLQFCSTAVGGGDGERTGVRPSCATARLHPLHITVAMTKKIKDSTSTFIRNQHKQWKSVTQRGGGGWRRGIYYRKTSPGCLSCENRMDFRWAPANFLCFHVESKP